MKEFIIKFDNMRDSHLVIAYTNGFVINGLSKESDLGRLIIVLNEYMKGELFCIKLEV